MDQTFKSLEHFVKGQYSDLHYSSLQVYTVLQRIVQYLIYQYTLISIRINTLSLPMYVYMYIHIRAHDILMIHHPGIQFSLTAFQFGEWRNYWLWDTIISQFNELFKYHISSYWLDSQNIDISLLYQTFQINSWQGMVVLVIVSRYHNCYYSLNSWFMHNRHLRLDSLKNVDLLIMVVRGLNPYCEDGVWKLCYMHTHLPL